MDRIAERQKTQTTATDDIVIRSHRRPQIEEKVTPQPYVVAVQTRMLAVKPSKYDACVCLCVRACVRSCVYPLLF